jgi:hypothetical protein
LRDCKITNRENAKIKQEKKQKQKRERNTTAKQNRLTHKFVRSALEVLNGTKCEKKVPKQKLLMHSDAPLSSFTCSKPPRHLSDACSSDYLAAGICRPLYGSANGKAEARCTTARCQSQEAKCGGLARDGARDFALQCALQ